MSGIRFTAVPDDGSKVEVMVAFALDLPDFPVLLQPWHIRQKSLCQLGAPLLEHCTKDTDPDAPLGYISDVVDKRIRMHGCSRRVFEVFQGPKGLHGPGLGSKQKSKEPRLRCRLGAAASASYGRHLSAKFQCFQHHSLSFGQLHASNAPYTQERDVLSRWTDGLR